MVSIFLITNKPIVMKNLLNKVKENPLPVIIGGLIFIVLFCVFMIATGGKKKVKKNNGFDETIVFEDLLDEENSGNFLFGDPKNNSFGDSNNNEQFFGNDSYDESSGGVSSNGTKSQTQRFLDSLRVQDNSGNQGDYTSEDSKEIQEIRRKIELEQQKKQERIEQGNGYSRGNRGAVKNYAAANATAEKKPVKSQTELERERYIQEYKNLQGAKKQAIKNAEAKTTTKDIVPPVRVRASIHNDHYIFPGDRVTLVLLEDLVSQKKLFKKGTLLYAKASFSQNRVLLDISNIQHEPFVLWGEDLQDGTIGMYVEQVADFNEKYATELQDEGVETTAEKIGEVIPNGLVGSMVSSVGNLFKNKKIKNKDRVFLINDHQVFLVNR